MSKPRSLPGMGQMLLPHRKGIYLDATSNLDEMTNNCGPPHQTSVNTRHDSAHLESPRYNNETMDDSEEIRYPKRKRQEVGYYDDDDDSGDYEDFEEQLEIKKVKVTPKRKERPLPKKKIFPFLQLPPELRNKVYEYALTDPKGHYIVAERRANRRVGSRVDLNTFKLTHPSKYGRWSRQQVLIGQLSAEEVQEGSRKHRLSSQWLRLSKTVYDEAIGYLYGRKFTFSDTNALHDFLTAIGPRMRGRLREIEVAEWGYSSAHKAMNYPAMSLLADAVNLERVWLNICHWNGTLVQKIFRDCATFLIAYGSVPGRKRDAAIEIIELPSSEHEKRPWQLTKSTRDQAANKKTLDGVRQYVLSA